MNKSNEIKCCSASIGYVAVPSGEISRPYPPKLSLCSMLMRLRVDSITVYPTQQTIRYIGCVLLTRSSYLFTQRFKRLEYRRNECEYVGDFRH